MAELDITGLDSLLVGGHLVEFRGASESKRIGYDYDSSSSSSRKRQSEGDEGKNLFGSSSSASNEVFQMKSGATAKRRRSTKKVDEVPLPSLNPDLLKLQLSDEMNATIAVLVFELGLKLSSPKLIMEKMPPFPGLTTEHIKSHLQKYRVHKPRSRDEFKEYFFGHLLQPFRAWEYEKSNETATYLQTLSEMRFNGETGVSGGGVSSSSSNNNSSGDKLITTQSNEDKVGGPTMVLPNGRGNGKSGSASAPDVGVATLSSHANKLIDDWSHLIHDTVKECNHLSGIVRKST